MPPDRRSYASPPRSPEMPPLSFISSSKISLAASSSMIPEIIPPIYIPESMNVSHSSPSWQNKPHGNEPLCNTNTIQQHRASKRQNMQSHEAQPRHHHLTRKQKRRFQDAHEEYHRQYELFQSQQQQQQRSLQQSPVPTEQEHNQEEQHSSHSRLAPSQRFSSGRSSLSRSSSSSSIYQSTYLDASESTTTPRSRGSSPGISEQHHHHHHHSSSRRQSPYSPWAALREKEHNRLLSNLSTLKESLQSVPLPSQVARENLGRLHQRIQRRRARTRETILYDLHQGVKVIEAQVHRQVEMVLSRLKEAPASKYAFAVTSSFLSQIPPTMTGSLLAQAANGLFQTDSSTIAHQEQQQETMSNSNGLEAISSSLDSIALTGQLEGERPSTLAGIGDPNGLSTKAPAGVAAACGQILTAALPSFIPSMVTPLVCVFSYQTPPISELAPISYTRHHQPDTTASSSTSSSSSIKKVEESAQKEFVYPWGHPNEPSPLPSISHSSQYKQNHPSAPSLPHSTTPSSLSPPSSSSSSSSSSPSPDYKSRKKRALVASVPDSGIVVFHSKTWTEHEREALYLAATRFRLCGQWSKIREMMNLHRTDQEIEAEYMKLYSHRDNDSDDDTLDDEKNDYYCIKPSIVDALTRERINHDDENDIDADDERDTEVFIKFGGHASALNRRQQSQYLQSKNMHIDQAYHPPQDQGQQQYQDNVPPHQNTRYHQQQSPQAMQQQQQQELESCPTDKNPWKLYKNELLIDKRFVLEDIPMRI